jgi:lipoic acid synthetase
VTLRTRWLGRVPYREAWAVQRALHGRHADPDPATVDDHLLLLEHPHVYTLGVRADLGHVLVSPDEVGAELVPTDRGGDVTYHGPGQLVGYPIISLPSKHGVRAQRPGAEGAKTGDTASFDLSAAVLAVEVDTVSRPRRPVRTGMADTVAYVRTVEQLIIDVLGDLGLPNAGRLDRYPGVWIDPGSDDPRKICAIGVRLVRGRSMHGFALNVAPDMRYWGYIVPCGIPDKRVTSLADEGIDVSMAEVVDVVATRAAAVWGKGEVERQDVVWRHSPDDLSAFTRGLGPGELVPPSTPPTPSPASAPASVDEGVSVRLKGRLAQAGVTEGLAIGTRKPEWLRTKVRTEPGYLQLKRTMRDLGLVTVCEEAGCPNIFECWGTDGTATFMINGERCTRACGFCLVDTRHPQALDPDEPEKVAEAVERMGLAFAVVTAVARDDLADGGARAFAATIEAIRRRTPATQLEVLIPDCKGDDESLGVIFDARPDVLNHNLETVARLQRAVRPSAGYTRSLSVLARAKEAGLTAKSGLIVGMGETDDEVFGALADLRGVGVDIVTIGQYLRPTTHHLPVARWVEPAAFERYAEVGRALGIGHVESSPLTRSSYHARQAAGATSPLATAQ